MPVFDCDAVSEEVKRMGRDRVLEPLKPALRGGRLTQVSSLYSVRAPGSSSESDSDSDAFLPWRSSLTRLAANIGRKSRITAYYYFSILLLI